MKDKLVFIAELPIYLFYLILGILCLPLIWWLRREASREEDDSIGFDYQIFYKTVIKALSKELEEKK